MDWVALALVAVKTGQADREEQGDRVVGEDSRDGGECPDREQEGSHRSLAQAGGHTGEGRVSTESAMMAIIWPTATELVARPARSVISWGIPNSSVAP
ncbi:hypothetical protein ACWD00_29310 [Streptomyces viridiviolaceus]